MFISRKDYPTIEAALADYPGVPVVHPGDDLPYAEHPNPEEQPASLYMPGGSPYIVRLGDGWIFFYDHHKLFDFQFGGHRREIERRLRAEAKALKRFRSDQSGPALLSKIWRRLFPVRRSM